MNNTNRNIVLFFIMLGFIIPMMTLAQSDKKLVRQGNKEFQSGNYNEAEINYRKALDKNPQKQSAQFNLGDALYEQENYEKAAEVFASSNVEKISNFEKSNTAYNLGNSFLKGGKLNESIAAYKQALKFNPENEEARYNLEYARQKQAQQEQQNQDQNKDDKKDQNQDQDQDKQDQNKDQQEQNQDQQDQNKDQQEQNQDQQQDQQNQQNQDKQNQQGQQNEQQAQKISKKDAERMLEALKNNEKKTLEKLKKEKKKNAKVIKSEKDW